MQTLSNDFHCKTIRVRNRDRALYVLGCIPAELTPADRALARRIRDGLCGAEGCTCGVVRGPQAGE